jgi:hypothetical protein
VQYSSYLTDNYLDAFRTAAKSHHIRLAHIFFATGKCVPPDEFPVQLENAVIEIMFSLKHYYYGPSTNRFKASKEGNTYSGTIEQVKILWTNTVILLPSNGPTMKPVPQTPPSQKGKNAVGIKHPNLLPPQEGLPSLVKKQRLKGDHECPLIISIPVLLTSGTKASSLSTVNTPQILVDDTLVEGRNVDEVDSLLNLSS